MLAEEWRVCEDFPHYSVSSLGRVMRTTDGAQPWSKSGKILSPEINKDGHARVTLFNNGKRTRIFVHRLVCAVWHGRPPSPDHLSCHANDDKSNNTPGNLYWGTRLDNGSDSVRNGKSVRGDRINTSKLSEGQVLEIRHKAAAGVLNTTLAAEYGIADVSISKIVSGKNWKHAGGPINAASRRGQPQKLAAGGVEWTDGRATVEGPGL